jgi:AcrR family transcriptional regulator
MRADARRNRRRLIDAAIELIFAVGGEPSRDAVAQRAGVGIGTLYRHFPDQQALLRAVVLDVLERLTDAARRDGVLGSGVTADDIAIASIRFCRPLAIGLDPAHEREIAHRHLDDYLDGLAVNAT